MRHPPTPSRWLILAAAAVGIGACAGPVLPETTPEEGAELCWPAFPYAEGWLGGDAAYSVPLSNTDTLWLFGDTFVGAPGQNDRQGAAFVHNSIGISRCHPDGRWEIDYAWGLGPNGAPTAFLDRGEDDAWWWLFDGFVHEQRLYLGLLEVEHQPPSGPLAMPFGFTGVQLARIANPGDPVDAWKLEVVSLSSESRALPASALVVHQDHLYLFVFLERTNGQYPRGIARLPLRALDGSTRDVSASLEYLARDGSWHAGLDPDNARVIMDDTATEMSVTFHPAFGRWVALYNYPDVGEGFPDSQPSDAVWIRTAERLEGPWSERRLIYRVPELDPDYAGPFDRNTGCYAAKVHPQLSEGRRITFTYVCNLFTGPGQDPNEILRRLVVSMGLYRPIPVSLDLPRALRTSNPQ